MHTFQNIRGREGGADQDSERQLSINPCTKYHFIGSFASDWAWGGSSPTRPRDVMKTDFRPETWGGDKHTETTN